jgi:hypothetical protein
MVNMRKVVRVGFAIFAIFAIGSFLVCVGGVFIAEIPWTIATGWLPFLGRVVPQVRPDPLTVLTALVSGVAATVGVDVMAAWLYPTLRGDASQRWKPRWTAFVVMLVVTLFLAGTAMVGMIHQSGWIVRSKEPMITDLLKSPAREGSMQNLKEIGRAIRGQ